MLTDFYIYRRLNDMKLAVQNNHLGGQILYRSPNPVKTASIFRLLILILQVINYATVSCGIEMNVLSRRSNSRRLCAMT